MSVAVAAGLEAEDEAWADAVEEEVLPESEDEDDTLVDVALACCVSTIVTETETVVGSGSSTSCDLVTVW